MNPTRLLTGLLTIIAVLIAVSILAGAVLGQPIGISYVETGSMSPTLDPGDGFIAVPTAVAGPIEPGDVIVFDAVNIHDGGLVTHRVVGETESGYITRGDANPVTDQDGEEPPVDPGRVEATALQVGGDVVVIPGFGTVVTGASGLIESLQQFLASTLGTRALLGTQGAAYLVFGFGVVTYVLASLAETAGSRRRDRRTSRWSGYVTPQAVIGTMAIVLILAVTASMVVPAGVHTFQFVSSEVESENPSVIQQGTTSNVTYVVPSNGPIPVVGVIEPASSGVSVSPQTVTVPGGETANVTVTIQAPPETGVYTESIREHRYLALLPTGVILTLYAVHPWLPIVVTDVLLGVGFIVVAVALIGIDPIRLDRRRRAPLRVRIRRWFK
ncbi:signal peptidase, endoplasmic reticulum-type [Halopenitus malekzadehii]|uniref:Signal peptidase, endoplasmic reticulum-type n=1 Tax=Halopenitus malekzadehii TaxID=1267564 RepID=A0A1H6I193_9EURY|nr:signal peptidase I [Halopenitus malekzadehii]SEH40171.1 signal peptidase, endoplasmic reticulum-type [Halopenitus malekzadehii]